MAPKLTTSVRQNGVAILTFSNPPANTLSPTMMSQISTALKTLLDRPDVRAVVIHGTNCPGFFSAGVDVSVLLEATATWSPFTPESSWCYSGCENTRIPVVAAIDGIAFGGGFELILCCTARVATKNSSFSLPELKLGIIPGLGGTQRLPRLIGFQPAVEMMLASKVISAETAHQLGLVDVVVQTNVIDAAVAHAESLLSSRTPIVKALERNDRIGDMNACEAVVQHLERTLIPKMSKNGQLPQYAATLDVALFGVKHGGAKGILEEADVFSRLCTAPHARSLIYTFFSTRQTAKVVLQNDSTPEQDGMAARKVGIIGGGLMGAGIATACISVGISVVIKELNNKFALAAKARVEKNLGATRKNCLRLLTVATENSALADMDIVIEAVVENVMLKQKIFAELESICRPDCILATNTSTINIDLIAMGAPKAHAEGRVIGSHFFSPAHKMPLLEIVRTESTSPKVIKDVIALGKKIKKTSVLVGNCAGFAVNRMYFPQSMVAGFLTVELGIDPYRIDRACEKLGLPMGPFRLIDLVGLDIGVAVGEVFEMAFADRAIGANPVMANMLSSGRKGQKSGCGFYKYEGKSRIGVEDVEGIAPFLTEARESLDKGYTGRLRRSFGELSDEDIINMIMLPCVNEGCRILDESVAQCSSDLDICSIMGMAFPAHKGGLMYWAQHALGGSVGVLNALELYDHRSEGFPLFKPSFALIRAAKLERPIGTMAKPALATGSPNDIVIVSAYRTPVGRAFRGGLKDTLPDDLLIPVLKKILSDTEVDVKEVDDVVAGTVLQRGDTGVVELRVAGLLSGLPVTVPVKTVNRLCSSGLQAIADGAASIQAGHHKIVIAGGFESMSMASMANKEMKPNSLALKHKEAIGCYMNMGDTSENVAEKYGISRDRQDRVAIISHARASQAKFSGRQSSEIVPIETQVKMIDKETKRDLGVKDVIVDSDEGVRMGVTKEKLAKLPAVFKRGGSTTAGNSSQLSDGAALVMLMKRSEASNRGLTSLASLRSFAVVGVNPATMGIGPAEAIPVALEKAGISVDQVDLFELNEAFGSQAEYCIEKLGLNRDIVNVMGGAIAIGHPLGMTGGRLSVSIIHELRRRGGRFGVVSMCVGSGMGAAAVFEIHKENGIAKM